MAVLDHHRSDRSVQPVTPKFSIRLGLGKKMYIELQEVAWSSKYPTCQMTPYAESKFENRGLVTRPTYNISLSKFYGTSTF